MINKTSKEKPPVTIAKELPGEDQLDLTLRPKTLNEYIGQEKIKEHLAIFLGAAKKLK